MKLRRPRALLPHLTHADRRGAARRAASATRAGVGAGRQQRGQRVARNFARIVILQALLSLQAARSRSRSYRMARTGQGTASQLLDAQAGAERHALRETSGEG